MISGFEWNAASRSGVVSSLFLTFGFAPAFSNCLTCADIVIAGGHQQGRRSAGVPGIDGVRREYRGGGYQPHSRQSGQQTPDHDQASTSFPVLSPSLSCGTLILSRNVSSTFESGVFSGGTTCRLPFTVFQPPTNEVGNG